jgi:hypothetical protein
MKRLVITLDDYGSVQRWTVETSSGVRSAGASLASALDRLLQTADPQFFWSIWDIPQDARYAALKLIFDGIRDTRGGGQIHEGVQTT